MPWRRRSGGSVAREIPTLRDIPISWPPATLDEQALVAWLAPPPFGPTSKAEQCKRRSGITGVQRWLRAQPGVNWQQRWLASGVEHNDGKYWRESAATWLRGVGDDTHEPDLSTGLLALLCGDVIRPSVRWMMTRQSPRFQAAMERSRDPEGFARLRTCCAENRVVGGEIGGTSKRSLITYDH